MDQPSHDNRGVNVLTLAGAPERGGFDWVVDGRPLDVWVSRWTPRALHSGLPTRDSIDLHALLSENASRLDSGRVPLYVCELCADVGCGVLAVRVAGSGDVVTWSDFAWEDGLPENSGPDPAYADVPVIRFDRAAYTYTIRRALTR